MPGERDIKKGEVCIWMICVHQVVVFNRMSEALRIEGWNDAKGRENGIIGTRMFMIV